MRFPISVCPKKPIFKFKIEHYPFFFFEQFDKLKWQKIVTSSIGNKIMMLWDTILGVSDSDTTTSKTNEVSK